MKEDEDDEPPSKSTEKDLTGVYEGEWIPFM